jgi:Tol biopolymer transport system component
MSKIIVNVGIVLLAATASAQSTLRVDLGPGGVQANQAAQSAGTSNSGSTVYASSATNLVPGDTNGQMDVFVSTPQGVTTRVSVSSAGVQGNGPSGTPQADSSPAISADGAMVAFESSASNLVTSDTNGVLDVFVRTLQPAVATTRVSVSTGSGQANGPSFVQAGAFSGDGRYVVFTSDATNLISGDPNGLRDVFLRDLVSDTTTLVSKGPGGVPANGRSVRASISANGNYIVYQSEATNLVASDTNSATDIFLYDRANGTTELVSLTSGGTQLFGQSSFGATVSGDGRYVAFQSYGPMIPADTNGRPDVYLRDRALGTTELVSIGESGAIGSGGLIIGAGGASISESGKLVAFVSDFTNLVTPDTNDATDVFVRDRSTGTTHLVSSSTAGVQGNAASYQSFVSPNAFFVGYTSQATNLVVNDTNAVPDVFLRTLDLPPPPPPPGRTEIVSVDSNEVQANGNSYYSPVTTPDGRFVVFVNEATNLVPGDTGALDVFVRDRSNGTTERVSVASTGMQANGSSGGNGSFYPAATAISADGRYVAFFSFASDLVSGDTNGVEDAFVRDRQNGTTERVSVATGGGQGTILVTGEQHDDGISISSDGRYVAFGINLSGLVPGDTNGSADIFVRDRQLGTTERVNLGATAPFGGAVYPSISADGRFVAFTSYSDTLTPGDNNGVADVFVRDRQNATTERVSISTSGAQGDMASGEYGHWISADGRYVAYSSEATNLVPGDTNGMWDIFVRDRQASTTVRASVASGGPQANGYSIAPSISGDGRFVTFSSNATNLVLSDSGSHADVFLHDFVTATTELVSVDPIGAVGNADSVYPTMSANGRFVTFLSVATNLVPGDANSHQDIFLRDRNPTGFTSLCDPGLAGVLACPCANPPSGPGRGCDNSSATGGAVLTAAGVSYLSADSLVFTASGEKPTATSILMQGPASIATGTVFGQGVRCVGGSLKRLYTKNAVGGSITAPDFTLGDASVSARSAALGDVLQPGQSRFYLVYYRDPIVLGGCPAVSAFNTTQTGRIDWSL